MIDDSLTVRMQVKDMLEAYGYQVELAQDGRQGLDMLSRNRPDIILLDAMMPEPDGIEVCRTIKNDDRLRDIPVLIVTSVGKVEEKVKGFQAGAEDYIVKPFVEEELLSRIAAHVKTAGLLRQLKDEVAHRKHAEAALKKAGGELEQQVRQRTMELYRTNAALKREIEERKRAEAAWQKTHDELEIKVAQRTAELSEAKRQAEGANAAKSDFLGRMSHEIRTPLIAVTGLTSIVLKTQLTAEQRNYLKKVQIASKNLLEVINDLLDFSKIEAGRLELEHTAFDLDQVMEQLTDLFSERATAKDLQLVFAVGPNVPRQLTGDPGRLAQVLTNLVENAIKFTDKGKIVIQVESGDAAFQRTGQTALKFTVSDTGVGIPADLLSSLFEPFTQAEGYLTRKQEGTGLGLSICKRLVELMGGRFRVESKPGMGSSFFFTVVFEKYKKEIFGRQGTMVERAASRPRVRDASHLVDRRILVVEDSELNLEVAVAILKEAGIRVETAPNGRIAVDKATRAPVGYYAAVLMDIQMPVMDGYRATRQIRQNELIRAPDQVSMDPIDQQKNDPRPVTRSRVPIIALTAHALKGEKEKCMAAGMDDYIAKPIDEAQLEQMLLKWIAPAAAEQAFLQVSGGDEQPATADATAVLDVQGALKRLGGRKDIYLTVLREFAPECAKADQIIHQSLDAGDRQTATRKAHSVKGVAATIGAAGLTQAVAKLQKMIEHNGGSIDDQMKDFQSELRLALQAVEGILSSEEGLE